MTHNFLHEVAKVYVDSEGNIAYSATPGNQGILRDAMKRREKGFRIGTAQLVEKFIDTNENYTKEQLLKLIRGKK